MRRQLPETYWLIMFVWLLIIGALSALAGSDLGVSPYIAASVGMVLEALRETWIVRQARR